MADDARTPPILMAGIAVASIVVVAAGLLVWRALSGDTPPEVALAPVTTTDAGDVTAEPDGTSPAPAAPGSFDGTWTIDTAIGSLDDGTATFAGYRIEEELGGVGTDTAVGRTRTVDGSMTIAGTTVTALSVVVDMTTLVSDDDRRDSQLVTRGLETARFPTATFTLTEPLELGSVPGEEASVSATARGDLTLHGVTRPVEVPVDARWSGDRIEVAGDLDVALADFSIEKPTGFPVLSIADTGTIEFHLVFTRA